MIQCYGQTICLTDKQFEFYGDAVIDRKYLQLDTAELKLKVKQKDTALINREERIKDLEQANKIWGLKSNNYKSDLSACGDKLNKKDKWNKIFKKVSGIAVIIVVLESIYIYFKVVYNI